MNPYNWHIGGTGLTLAVNPLILLPYLHRIGDQRIHNSATTIQRLLRGRRGRRIAYARRIHHCATKIQSLLRGRRGRRIAYARFVENHDNTILSMKRERAIWEHAVSPAYNTRCKRIRRELFYDIHDHMNGYDILYF